MSRMRSRVQRLGECVHRSAPFTTALLVALVLAGCASRSQSYAPTADVRPAPPASQAAATRLAGTGEPELEDDGLPAQRPPLVHRQRRPDDPSEPFSPNYGAPPMRSAAAARVTEAPANHAPVTETSSASHHRVRLSARDLPDDLPPDFHERLIVVNGLH